MPRSLGGTTCANVVFDLLTYSSVSSMRVPVGALRLITNCPGSVRGKNETPSNG